MNRREIEEQVRRVLAECLDKRMSEVTLEARFKEDLDVDSLNRAEAIVALEEEFDVEVKEEDMETIKTVREAVDLVAGDTRDLRAS